MFVSSYRYVLVFKKRRQPCVGRLVSSESSIKRKACRRSKKKSTRSLETIVIMYANIQGFSGKKTSLQHSISALNADVILLAETMSRKISLKGCQCVCPKESVGQNVAVVLSGSIKSCKKMKLYEPNEIINMIGVRLDIKGVGVRFYTAHLKQQSTTSRDDIAKQFDEIINQFRSANYGREAMLIVFDANVHVGSEGINGCEDVQDWGGQKLLSLVRNEGLTIINNSEKCEGLVTRVDPRNGSKTTIDLAICNTFMVNDVLKMSIDENEKWRLKKYGKKVTQTDHNTITLELKVKNCQLEQNKNQNKELMKRYNFRNEEARKRMQDNIHHDPVINTFFSNAACDINKDLDNFIVHWNNLIDRSFDSVKPSKNRRPGVDPEVKTLLKEEMFIRNNVKENVERGKKLAEIQKRISEKIAENVSMEMEGKVKAVIESKQPQTKVFSVRRDMKKTHNMDFPLKDSSGVMQVSRSGVDKVIGDHFKKVFAQNPVPDEPLWEEYWKIVDDIFHLIDVITGSVYRIDDEPTFKEIDTILREMSANKSSFGSLSIDLAKLGGEKVSQFIYRCILVCFQNNAVPDTLRKEKMVLLLKSRGVIDDINDYRGIFLRNVIVSVYQKWLYSKNSQKVDDNGSEFACGGRKNRSVSDPLLVVKLIQDYAKWTKKETILKFLDVEKFFDLMNYKLALIEAFNNGVDGQYWQCYKTLNSSKSCIPYIPSGSLTPIDVNNVFVQGSCDAVLVAWPLMDADSKKSCDCFSSDFCIEGIAINRLSFVDDLFEVTGSVAVTNENCVSSEVFEKKTRLNFKLRKCKVISMNPKNDEPILLKGEVLEKVEEHIYLGTIISANGERFSEMDSRISKSKSVSNEIEQICRSPELSLICLWYVKLLICSCFDSKLKFGCALWNVTKFKSTSEKLNKIKPNLLKHVLKIPASTPSAAVQYEFGINDMVLDILLEKVWLGVETLKLDENRISKQILKRMLEKKVPGFCTELLEACEILGVSIDELVKVGNTREELKRKVIQIQSSQLMTRMVAGSKMDKVILSGFMFDGKMKRYLSELDFHQARAVFMIRYRMWPTKDNFPGRWSGTSCNICGLRDTDEHVFSCPGYSDIVMGKVQYSMFWDNVVLNDMDKLSKISTICVAVLERMEQIQNLEVTPDALSPNE